MNVLLLSLLSLICIKFISCSLLLFDEVERHKENYSRLPLEKQTAELSRTLTELSELLNVELEKCKASDDVRLRTLVQQNPGSQKMIHNACAYGGAYETYYQTKEGLEEIGAYFEAFNALDSSVLVSFLPTSSFFDDFIKSHLPWEVCTMKNLHWCFLVMYNIVDREPMDLENAPLGILSFQTHQWLDLECAKLLEGPVTEKWVLGLLFCTVHKSPITESVKVMKKIPEIAGFFPGYYQQIYAYLFFYNSSLCALNYPQLENAFLCAPTFKLLAEETTKYDIAEYSLEEVEDAVNESFDADISLLEDAPVEMPNFWKVLLAQVKVGYENDADAAFPPSKA